MNQQKTQHMCKQTWHGYNQVTVLCAIIDSYDVRARTMVPTGTVHPFSETKLRLPNAKVQPPPTKIQAKKLPYL